MSLRPYHTSLLVSIHLTGGMRRGAAVRFSSLYYNASLLRRSATGHRPDRGMYVLACPRTSEPDNDTPLVLRRLSFRSWFTGVYHDELYAVEYSSFLSFYIRRIYTRMSSLLSCKARFLMSSKVGNGSVTLPIILVRFPLLSISTAIDMMYFRPSSPSVASV